MTEKGQLPGNLEDENQEGEPYGTIAFQIYTGTSDHVTYQVDCNLSAPLICGLKEDFAEMFDIPQEMQKWYFRDQLLRDDTTLWENGIKGTEDVMVTIRVIRG